ncbi:telomere-protecting terminal protein Tpg [Streptomyces sp. SD31]
MGQIVKGLERALLPRPVPTRDAAARFLLKTEKNSTKNVAVLLGISQRTVQRWTTTRPGMRRNPSAVHAGLIDEAVRARWQPRVRARLRAPAEADGFVLHTRARFGFDAPAGSSDDPRVRLITPYLSGEMARELFAARDAGAGEQQMAILARALGHAYFRDAGLRAHGPGIAFTNVEFADFSIG